MKKFDPDGSDLTKTLDFSFLDSASESEIEAACMYEHWRESQTLRNGISESKNKSSQLPSSFAPHLTFAQQFRLLLRLQEAGFPKPWRELTEESQRQLVSSILE